MRGRDDDFEYNQRKDSRPPRDQVGAAFVSRQLCLLTCSDAQMHILVPPTWFRSSKRWVEPGEWETLACRFCVQWATFRQLRARAELLPRAAQSFDFLSAPAGPGDDADHLEPRRTSSEDKGATSPGRPTVILHCHWLSLTVIP